MSALFFKLSMPYNIDKYRELQSIAKQQGLSLRVKNTSRTRGLPCFIFYLKDRDRELWFSSLTEVGTELAKLGRVA